MKRFKRWLIENFLPVYLKKELMQENEKLREQIRDQQIHIRELNAYIEGLELAIRSQRRITINNQMAEQPSAFIPDPNYKPPEEVRT